MSDTTKKQSHPNIFMSALQAHKSFFYIYLFFFLICALMKGNIMITYGDAPLYRCYAMNFWHGSSYIIRHAKIFPECAGFASLMHEKSPPFHALPLEYPLLSLLPFSIPLLAPYSWYFIIFSASIFLCILGLFIFLKRVGKNGAAFAYIIYTILGGWIISFNTFDLIPSALVLFSLTSAIRKKFYLSYIFLALGVWFKLYPLFLFFPVFFAQQQSFDGVHSLWTRLKGFFIFTITCSFFLALSFFINSLETLRVLFFFIKRPIEILSMPATVLWLLSLIGLPVGSNLQFGSRNIVYNPHQFYSIVIEYVNIFMTLFLPFFLVVFVTGTILLVYLQWNKKLTITETFLGIVLLLLLTNKVFSPQYLTWVAPLLAYARGLEKKWVFFWGSICLLTIILYPFLASLPLENPSFVFFSVAAVRNFLLLVFTVYFLYDAVRKNTLRAKN